MPAFEECSSNDAPLGTHTQTAYAIQARDHKPIGSPDTIFASFTAERFGLRKGLSWSHRCSQAPAGTRSALE